MNYLYEKIEETKICLKICARISFCNTKKRKKDRNWRTHVARIRFPRGPRDPRTLETGYQSGEIYLTINRPAKKAFSTRCSNEWNTSSFRTARAHTGLYSEYEYNAGSGYRGALRARSVVPTEHG